MPNTTSSQPVTLKVEREFVGSPVGDLGRSDNFRSFIRLASGEKFYLAADKA